jgi:hypothetical protein
VTNDERRRAADSGEAQRQVDGSDPLQLSRHIKKPGPAPVHLWDPPFCGELDMRIARDGTWYHEGRPIRRPALVQLFSSVLKREGDRHFLVTPVEKVGIQVDDCPFVVVAAEVSGSGQAQRIELTLNTGEQLVVDGEHGIEVAVASETGEPHPVVQVRGGLYGLLSRNVFYQLVEHAESRQSDGKSELGVWSSGHFFKLGEDK